MGDSLPRTPINHRAKFDTTSFILGGEIRNFTNTQKTNEQTNKQYTIYPHLAYWQVWIITVFLVIQQKRIAIWAKCATYSVEFATCISWLTTDDRNNTYKHRPHTMNSCSLVPNCYECIQSWSEETQMTSRLDYCNTISRLTVPWPLASKYTPMSNCLAAWCRCFTPVDTQTTGRPYQQTTHNYTQTTHRPLEDPSTDHTQWHTDHTQQFSLSSGLYAAHQKRTYPNFRQHLLSDRYCLIVHCSAGAAQSHRYGFGAAYWAIYWRKADWIGNWK